ncbi:hypothetical protein C8R47DRAFT_1072185 [Mycena vitilis]|nr:hypothetical protein C8R47DRAFT_1072185 [Mycena vitilis]
MDTNNDINTVNASEELTKIVKQLGAYKKANAKTKAGMGGRTYKRGLEGRIKACEGVIARMTIDSNARTLEGSPNDPVPPGGMSIWWPVWWSPSASLPQPFNYTTPDELLFPMAPIMDNTYLLSVDQIDPDLLPPPTKKPKTNQPRHRKTVMVEPLEAVVVGLGARPLAVFIRQWRATGSAVESAAPASTADTVPDLRDAAIEIIDYVIAEAEKGNYSAEDLNWTMNDPSGRLTMGHVVVLHEWLVAVELMDADIQQQALPVVVEKGAALEDTTIWIWDNGKKVAMGPGMLVDARLHPSLYPGCVEEGMPAVEAVLKNRAHRTKCISCDGQRGKVLDDRPPPPVEDHPYLAQCKCPLRGAALELWMIKKTASDPRVPQRGGDDAAVKNRRLALNPDVLKLIASAIQAASGHEIETLLQPAVDRLEFTAHCLLFGTVHAAPNETIVAGVTSNITETASSEAKVNGDMPFILNVDYPGTVYLRLVQWVLGNECLLNFDVADNMGPGAVVDIAVFPPYGCVEYFGSFPARYCRGPRIEGFRRVLGEELRLAQAPAHFYSREEQQRHKSAQYK